MAKTKGGTSQLMTLRKVVITGIGAVTPLGLSVDETWHNLIAGKSGITRITSFDASRHAVQIAGEVKGFDPKVHLPITLRTDEPDPTSPLDLRKKPDRMHPVTWYGVTSTAEAVRQACLCISRDQSERAGVFFGSGGGGLTEVTKATLKQIEKGPRFVEAAMAYKVMSNATAGKIAQITGICGPVINVSSACATGSDAIGLAAKHIAWGEIDVAIAGGSEAVTDMNTIAAFGNLQALTKDFNDRPEEASRPFDRMRSGFVFAEGSASLVLESEEHALARGATILGYVTGYAATNDAYHETKPNGIGARRAIEKVLANSGLAAKEISAILLHGTSTPDNDKFEAEAVENAFGENTRQPPAAGIKSQLGHLIGAAGAIAPIIAIRMVASNIVPGTANLTSVDTGNNLNLYREIRKEEVVHVLCNAFGFGGHDSCLVISRAA